MGRIGAEVGSSGGSAIPPDATKDAGARIYDFARLERAVVALADQHQRCVQRNAELLAQLQERSQRIRVLEEELFAANQRRQDVAKRLDELIAQIDQLEGQMAALDGVT